jgi:hypothetical protein
MESLIEIVIDGQAYPVHGEFILIDGVRVSTEVLKEMFRPTEPDRWLRFERKGDNVVVHQRLESCAV